MADKTVTREAQAKLTAKHYDDHPEYEGHAYSFWRDKDGQLYELRYADRSAAADGDLQITAVDDAGRHLTDDA